MQMLKCNVCKGEMVYNGRDLSNKNDKLDVFELV